MRPPVATPSPVWAGHTQSWAPGTWSPECQWWRHVQCSVLDTWHVTWLGCTRVQGTMATATSQPRPVSSYRSSVSIIRGKEILEISKWYVADPPSVTVTERLVPTALGEEEELVRSKIFIVKKQLWWWLFCQVCKVSGVPAPSLRWFRNNKILDRRTGNVLIHERCYF